MKIVVFGAGPIGLVTSLSLSYLGHDVLCMDTKTELIQNLQSGVCGVFEKDLQKQLESALSKNTIRFTTDRNSASHYSNIFFVAVGTPNHSHGNSDLTQIESCLESIHQTNTTAGKIIIIKSTVPPGTNQRLSQNYKDTIFVSFPEFLREGTAFEDALHPHRIVIGCTNSVASELLQQIFSTLIQNSKLILTDPTTAELSKYAANTFLAARISLINEFSKLADYFNGDIKTISQIIGSDHRIGSEFLNAGIGYGGSCFPKDLQSLISIGNQIGIDLPLTHATEVANEQQHKRFIELVKQNCKEKKVCVWGLTFKPETNDLRNASSLKIVNELFASGFQVHVHDPTMPLLIKEIFADEFQNKKIIAFENHWESLNDCSGLLILTEWPIYQNIELTKLSQSLNNKPLFDGRNIFDPVQMKKEKIKYFSLGQKK